VISNPISIILCKQALLANQRSLIKNSIFVLENLLHIGLEPCCEFCKIYENGLA
jgi:hypothetical protein